MGRMRVHLHHPPATSHERRGRLTTTLSPLGGLRAVLFDDKAAQDLATARLGDGAGDHHTAPQFLEGRPVCRQESNLSKQVY